MTRVAAFLLFVVALAASGYTLVEKDFRPTAPTGATLPPAEAAARELNAAAGALEGYRAIVGTYHGASVELFAGLRLARASESGYCIEVGGHALAGPNGQVVRGRCAG